MRLALEPHVFDVPVDILDDAGLREGPGLADGGEQALGVGGAVRLDDGLRDADQRGAADLVDVQGFPHRVKVLFQYGRGQLVLRVPVDTSSGTIWAKAEELVGEQITGTNRRDALDEMIVKLVNYKKDNLPRLPGSDLVDAAKGAIKNVTGLVTGNSGHDNPMNKPMHQHGEAIPGGYGDTLYQAANNRTNFNTLFKVGDTIGDTFYNR